MSAHGKYTATPGQHESPPLIQARDALLMAAIAGLAIPAWLLRQGAWPRFANRVARITSPVLGRRTPHVFAAMQASSGTSATSAPLLYREWIARRIEQDLQVLREHRPGGWRPILSIEGLEHLRQAQAGGHGGILWVAPQWMAGLIVKKALHAAGFAVAHLSRSYHGPSDSRFGRRFINPLFIKCENRYLADRFALQAKHEGRALRPLVQALKHGKLVSITCAGHGQRLFELPVLRGRLPVATGAATLALRGEADLLPVCLQRRGADEFAVIVQPPLTKPANGNRQTAVAALMQAYAQRLGPALEADPAGFADWRNLMLSDPSSGP